MAKGGQSGGDGRSIGSGEREVGGGTELCGDIGAAVMLGLTVVFGRL